MRRFFAARKRETVPAPPDAAPSSASSSSGSADHVHPPIPIPLKRSWKPWTAAKRSLSLKYLPDWSLPHTDTDTDLSIPDDDPDDDDRAFLTPASSAIHVLRTLNANALVAPPPVSPFVQLPDGHLFPRSVNPRHRLPRPPADTRVALFRKQLAARALSPADTAAIASLAARPVPAALHPPSVSDISRPSKTTTIFPASPGLRRWIARPCFEDRHVIYLPSDKGIVIRPVSSSWAVAALEYPEHLDVMVCPDFDQSPPLFNVASPSPPLEHTLAATLSHAQTTDQILVSAPPAHTRNSYTAIPSPLRNEHAPPPLVAPPADPPSEQPANHKTPAVKRVVRFVEDDSDDGVPLHIVRMKKKRDQKSIFLRQQQLKRAREEEAARRQDAQRAQQEALEKERQRLAVEKERRERERAHYADQVVAARARREISRAGGTIPSNTANPNNTLLHPSSSYSSLRDAERNNPPPSESGWPSRLNHDVPPSISIPRREASEHALHSNSHPNKRFSDSSSPDSSRPPSLAYSPVSPGYSHSRPPSTYSAHTSSSEDVRHQSAVKHNLLSPSVAPSAYAHPPIIATYPTWSGSNPNLHYAPPVPPFQDFISDMPLLPPTAPFMKHARPRSTSSSSRKDPSPGPSSSSSRRGSVNSSSERVNLAPKGRGSSSRDHSSSPRPPQQRHASTPVKPTHERRLSGESRTTAHTQHTSNTHRQSSHYQQTGQRPVPVSSRSQPVLARGRPEQPAWSQPQAQFMQMSMNPWLSGLPAMQMPMSGGMPYMGMPVVAYPMMPMMTSSQTDLRGANVNMNIGTPRGGGGTPGRRVGENRAAAIS